MESIKERIVMYVAMIGQIQDPGVTIFLESGRKYAKVVTIFKGLKKVHTFVDMKNGNILKASSWSAPASKGIRGSVLSEDLGRSCVNKYGAKYLK